ERAVAVELRRRRPDHRQPPAAGAAEAAELREERVELVFVPYRVAADERRAGDDAVGEERAPSRREQVALVPTESEEREAVLPVALHERPRGAPLRDGLRHGLPERPQPEVEPGEPEHEPGRAEGVRDAVR